MEIMFSIILLFIMCVFILSGNRKKKDKEIASQHKRLTELDLLVLDKETRLEEIENNLKRYRCNSCYLEFFTKTRIGIHTLKDRKKINCCPSCASEQISNVELEETMV